MYEGNKVKDEPISVDITENAVVQKSSQILSYQIPIHTVTRLFLEIGNEASLTN